MANRLSSDASDRPARPLRVRHLRVPELWVDPAGAATRGYDSPQRDATAVQFDDELEIVIASLIGLVRITGARPRARDPSAAATEPARPSSPHHLGGRAPSPTRRDHRYRTAGQRHALRASARAGEVPLWADARPDQQPSHHRPEGDIGEPSGCSDCEALAGRGHAGDQSGLGFREGLVRFERAGVGQFHGEDGSSVRRVCRGDGAAVLVDDAVDDREAQAAPGAAA